MSVIGSRHGDLVSVLRARAENTPSQIALRFLGAGESCELDYAQFDRRVRAAAARLQAIAAPGERALLLFPTGPHYATAFFACLYAGLIAVPAYPPESRRRQHLDRPLAIAADARPRLLLTESAALDDVAGLCELLRQQSQIEIVCIDHIDDSDAALWRMPTLSGDTTAFLQYTSGSTSLPKGVQLGHASIMANLAACQAGFGVGPGDAGLSWLPLYHDMGLVSGLLLPVYSGAPSTLLPTRRFLEQPLRWMEALGRYGGGISGGPEFAYRLCVDRVPDSALPNLDLRGWRVAFCGAEPIRAETLRAFADKFAPAGFDPQALVPCYGLAETCVFVSATPRGQGLQTLAVDGDALARGQLQTAAGGVSQIGCGIAAAGHRIVIADALSGEPLADDRVGEICYSGPSLARGYWNNDEATAQAFVMRRGERLLRTGDLGFIHRGQLFVSGRIKDLIVVRGRNLYPQDIERAVEAVPGVRGGRVAAFAWTLDGRERIGIAVETSRSTQKKVPAQALARALAEAIAAGCQESPGLVLLLQPGGMPKTSSGKLQRSACRRGWEEATLNVFAAFEDREVLAADGRAQLLFGALAADAIPAAATPRDIAVAVGPYADDVERGIAEIWSQRLNRPRLSPRDSFLAVGGDSLAAVQVAAQVAERYGIDTDLPLLLEAGSLHEYAAAVAARIRSATDAAKQTPIGWPHADRSAELPLSPAQSQLWFLAQLDPDSTAYHVPAAVDLHGALDVAALEAAIQHLIVRHESLRTSFHDRDGVAMQRVHAQRPVAMRLHDASGNELRAAEVEAGEIAQPFDLAHEPLVRTTLLRLAPDHHRLLLTLHHLVCDGASLRLLLDELSLAYEAIARGVVPELAPLPLQYVDWALRERQRPAAEHQRLLDWWRAQLGDEHPPLSLPAGHPDGAAARLDIVIGPVLQAGVKAAAAERGLTPFMLLLGAWQLCLQRHSGGHDEVRVGVPAANREHRELQSLVGFFVNTLVLRATPSGDLRVGEFCEQLRRSVLGAQAHQALPFQQLVEALQVQRSADHNPLFQVMHNHQNLRAASERRLAGLCIRARALAPPVAPFELMLDTIETDDGLSASLSWSTARFGRIDAENLAERWLLLLEGLIGDPGCRLCDLRMLPRIDAQGLASWSTGTAAVLPPPAPWSVVEAQAGRTPAALALIDGARTLRYDELLRDADALARRLVAAGAGADQRVGLAVGRGLEGPLGMLAILRAGAAYLPLDPAHPPARLSALIADSGVRLLLTEHALAASFAVLAPQLRVLTFGTDADGVSALPQREHAEALAYCLYTSGSTGRPKGVAMRRGAVSQLMRWHAERWPQPMRTLQFASLGFDVSFQEIFATWMQGGTLVLAPDDARRDPQQLAALLREREVERLFLPFAVLQTLAESLRDWPLPALRQIVTAGEALKLTPALDGFLAAHPQCVLVNQYGPTEAHVVSEQVVDVHAGAVLPPIGRPIAGSRLWVLDADLNPLPPGVTGELYIGGAGLARGYLGRAAQTADRFVPDPFGQPGERLYRSGDLARWCRDGKLDYLGRRDQQVKIRGFRVDPGETEAQLAACDGVREAAVLAQDSAAGLHLLAYVVGEGAADRGWIASLEQRLRDTLPPASLPSRIIALDRLPLNANGKLDRRALAALAPVETARGAEPQTAAQQQLAAIWRELLGLQRVGLQDHFFEIGGHSLAAMRLLSRIRAQWGQACTLRELFAAPTLQAMAALLERAPSAADEESPALIALQRSGELELSSAQRRLWLVDRLGGGGAYNMVAALMLEGRLDESALRAAVQALADRHDTLRTRFIEVDGEPRMCIDAQAEVTIDAIDLQSLPLVERQARLAALCSERAAAPFDLSQAPLLRATLVKLEHERSVLLIVLHHIAADGWSVALLIRDFAEAYRAHTADREPGFAPLPLRYADFAAWQNRMLNGDRERRLIDYWHRQLEGVAAELPLPRDRARSQAGNATGNSRGAALSLVLDAALARRVDALALTCGTTAYAVLLAAFSALLHRETGNRDLLVGIDVAGREQPQLESLVGFFVNLLPVRTRIAPPTAFTTLLAQTHDTLLAAYEHQALPFDRLVEAVQPQRRGRHNPLVQVLFVMQNAPRTDFDLPQLMVSLLPLPQRSSKFDLAVFAEADNGTLKLEWLYACELFDAATIERLSAGYAALLEQLVTAPDRTLPAPVAAPSAQTKLVGLRRPTPRVAHDAGPLPQVRIAPLLPQRGAMPLLVEPLERDLDAAAWAGARRAAVGELLLRHGALLFRGFAISTAPEFESFAEALMPELHGDYGDLPKEHQGQRIYHSTPYPEDKMILFHNESSHLQRWPRQQAFFCERTSQGGATPIVDGRQMLARLPVRWRLALERRRLRYVRTFIDKIDVDWREFFKTDRRDEVERRCAVDDMQCRWLEDGSPQIDSPCSAIVRHPETGEAALFNQIQLHHPAFLDADLHADLIALVGHGRLPRNVCYGDGAPLEDELVATLAGLYEQCAVRFDWQRGDVLLLDNMLVAHARDPYRGPRKIVVAMGAMMTRRQLEAADAAHSRNAGAQA